jgi:hypothetical protein
VIDLSVPEQPVIRGALEIDGVSEYLQLLNENLLLGIGQIENKVQVSLFDVSQPDAPILADRFVTGGKGSSSPAFWDYKALAWLQDSQAASTRLALPVSINDENWQLERQGLQLFTFDLNANQIVDDGFVTAFSDYNSGYYGTERALIDGQNVHYINGTWVWSAPWAAPEQVVGPQGFEPENPVQPESPIDETNSDETKPG